MCFLCLLTHLFFCIFSEALFNIVFCRDLQVVCLGFLFVNLCVILYDHSVQNGLQFFFLFRASFGGHIAAMERLSFELFG